MRQHTTTALPLDQARLRIAATIEPVTDVERVALVEALNRVLAADLVSTVDVPGHDNAAMDGYALPRARFVNPATGASFTIVGTARAGHPYDGPVATDQCVRIMTGAVMPADCDAVVPQEQAVIIDGCVRCDVAIAPGQHRRPAGEDLRVGQVALPRGRRIVPADLGVAASIGCATLDVLRRPRVAVFSTGAELCETDEPLRPGSIRDANRYTLIGMLQRLDVDVVDLGIVDDDPAALEAVLRRACRSNDGSKGADGICADAVITSGGVSVGDADHTRAVMARLGSVDFWSLAVKPGRPMAFGRIASDGRDALLFGLPGNPVAVMVVFYALVREALLALAGGSPEPLPCITAICDEDLAKAPGRTEFLRGVARRETDGWHVRTTGSQGSGVLRSMTEANCLIVLAHDRGHVTRGAAVETWPFAGLL
jgi:molybdopterin molybdotransferase